jgi:hypothetical protein
VRYVSEECPYTERYLSRKSKLEGYVDIGPYIMRKEVDILRKEIGLYPLRL